MAYYWKRSEILHNWDIMRFADIITKDVVVVCPSIKMGMKPRKTISLFGIVKYCTALLNSMLQDMTTLYFYGSLQVIQNKIIRSKNILIVFLYFIFINL